MPKTCLGCRIAERGVGILYSPVGGLLTALCFWLGPRCEVPWGMRPTPHHVVEPSAAAQTASTRDKPALVTWFIFPTLVAGIALGTWQLLGRDLPRPAATGLPLVLSVLLIMGLERVFAVHRAWNRRPDAKDLVLLVFNRFLDVALLVGTVTLVAALGETIRFASLWPTAWPVPLQVLAGILLGETLRYGMHRYSHRPGFWWRVHRTHHEPDRMYVLNGPRLHPANYLWVAAAHVVPMLLLGAPLPVVLVVINVTALFVVFQHANLRLCFDGLNQVLATPDVHRLHHARKPTAKGVNYAIIFVLVDRVFGTYAPPTDELGVDGIGPADPQGTP